MNLESPCSKGAHVLVIPYPGCGHLLPHIDLVHQLALRGLQITVIVTPKNLSFLNSLLSLHPSIETLVLPFPSHPSLPPGVENLQELPAEKYLEHLSDAMSEFYEPVVQWFKNHPKPPVANIPDVYLSSWTHRLAAHFNIRLIGFVVLNANSFLQFSEYETLSEYPFYDNLYRETRRCWGLVFNSFTEIEKENLEAIKAKYLGHDKVWAVGPLPPILSTPRSKFERGGPSSIRSEDVLAWLDTCELDRSVVYVGFGSQITLNKRQMEALASALDDSGARFIWVVKDPMKDVESGEVHDQSVVPEGFEDRIAGRGLVIKGWAPQALILHHRAVGCYLTHCGWNSVLEGLVGGVLLLAWPMQVDHFVNAQMFVDQLDAAIRVCEGIDTVPDSHKLSEIIKQSVTGNCRQRIQAMKLREKALEAIKEGGSSFDI